MVCLQVIDLFPEQNDPQVLAKKLDHVETVKKSRTIAGESVEGS